MSILKGRDRRRDFETLEESAVKDYDPENEPPATDDESDDGEAYGGNPRQHYADVSKSKLRKPKEAALGPQYRGSKISRDDMMLDDEEHEDDPFSKDFEDEYSEESDGLSVSGDDMEEDNGEEQDETDDTEMSDENDSPAGAVDRAELRRAMASESSTVAATISAASKADAEKGRAVLQQRATFDALLNARIKLQKSLIASNSLVALSADDLGGLRNSQDDAIQKAEQAALALWTSLSQFRQKLDSTSSQKLSKTASTEVMLKQLKLQDESVRAQRNATLQKWSIKSRGVSATPQHNRLNNEQPATIVDVLNEHLASSDRLLKRARTPRSCAPVQLSKRVEEDDHIYDDADFYGLLLKELLEAKSSAASAAATNVVLTSFANMRREAKTKKNVDTKASKGRKLRYTVHEKLQNYCAAEDRTTWGDRQVEELFSSLFGQRADLAEDRTAENDVEMGEEDVLTLFRS